MTMVAEQERNGDVPERWSAKAKNEVVLRLPGREGMDEVSREVLVPAHEAEAWRRKFLEMALEGFKRRHGDQLARLLKEAQAKVRKLAMRLELAEMLLEKGSSRISGKRRVDLEEEVGVVSEAIGTESGLGVGATGNVPKTPRKGTEAALDSTSNQARLEAHLGSVATARLQPASLR